MYNQKTNENLSYNQILDKYLLKPLKIKSFSIKRPKNGIYNKKIIIEKYLNGSPAGGYWMNVKDLHKFGKYLENMYNKDTQFKKLVIKYGKEYYRNGIIIHSGGLSGSTSYLAVEPKQKITIAIMSANGKDACKLYSDILVIYKISLDIITN